MKKIFCLVLSITLLFIFTLEANANTSFAVYSGNTLYGINYDYPNIDIRFGISGIKDKDNNDKKVFHADIDYYGNMATTAGMNQDGLMMYIERMYPTQPISDYLNAGDLEMTYLAVDELYNAGSVSEIEDYIANKNIVNMYETVKDFFADKNGAIVVEPGVNKITKSTNNFLISTNFSDLSLVGKNYKQATGEGSDRYINAYEYISKNLTAFDVDKAFETLKQNAQVNGPNSFTTQASLVFSPNTNEIFVAIKRDFSKIWRISLDRCTIESYKGFNTPVSFNINGNTVLLSDLFEKQLTKVTGFKANSESNNSVELTWDAKPDIKCYEIYGSSSLNGIYSLIATPPKYSTSFNVPNQTTGTNYYKIRACYFAGTKTAYTDFSPAIYAKVTPSVPANFKCVPTSYYSAKLTWDAVAYATGYQVYRSTSPDGTYSLVNTTATTNFSNTNLTTGTTYYYKVRAYRYLGPNNNVFGDYTGALSAKPNIVAPTGLTASANTFDSIKLTWGAVSGATGYQVFRASSANGDYTLVNTTTSTSFINTNLATGATYYYKVRAYRYLGQGNNVFGNYSAYTSCALNAVQKPPIPVNFKVTSSTYNSVSLSWDKTSNTTGYQVYRSTSQNGTYTLVNTTTATSFTDANLTTGNTYYYKVRAYRYLGPNSNIFGDYTKVLSVKPTLSSPNNFKAAKNNAVLTWDTVEGATGYQVCRSTSYNGDYTLVSTTTATIFVDTKIKAETKYYYKVRAYRYLGINNNVFGDYSITEFPPVIVIIQ